MALALFQKGNTFTFPRSLISTLGGRRFMLSLGAGVVSSILVWYSKITPEIYRDVIIACVAVYIGGNTWQKTKAPNTDSRPINTKR